MAPGPSGSDESRRAVEAELAKAELDLLRYRKVDPPKALERWEFGDGLAGLAFSGGGIRSATFNLGFLQALLKCRLFRRFHFLSTVSGGGYLGSMISAHAEVAAARAGEKAGFPYDPDSPELDKELVKHVREHCRYLTPSNGSRFGDLLSFAVVLLRGLAAHVLLASVFFGLIAVPFFIPSYRNLPPLSEVAPKMPWAAGITAVVVLAIALGTLFSERVFSSRVRGVCNALLKLGLIALLLELALYGHWRLERAKLEIIQHAIAGLLGTSGIAGAFGALRGAADAFESWSRWRKVVLRVAPYVVVLGLGYFLLWVFREGLFRIVAGSPFDAAGGFDGWCKDLVGTFERARSWVSFVLLGLVVAHAVVLFKSGPPGAKRFGGRRLQVALYVGGVSLVLLPALFTEAGEAIVSWMVLGCLAGGLSAAAIKIALGGRRALLLPAALLAVFFTFTLARALSWVLHHDHLSLQEHAYWHLYLVLLQSGVVFSLFFDLNATSLHGFYRDRLADLFLHEPRGNRPLPDGELSLGKLARNARRGFPFHLINCAVSLPASEDRRVAERQVDSFVVSGARIGSLGLCESGTEGLATPREYRLAGEPVTLPAAMAVSGAAVSSHFGAGVPWSVSALMTILNARLGLWWPNPRHLHGLRVPPFLAFPIWPATFVKEMLSAFDPRTLRCLVSDGGHFDNLGLYELVRRRCRYIVVSDAGADPERRFADLGNAIRRCRVDFDVNIELDTELLKADPATGQSARHVVVGTIQYPRAGRGILVYVKSSLTGDEPPDVLQYRRDHPAFPHESTADQDFDEAQFESYRKLGEHGGEEVFGTKRADGDLGEFFAGVRDRWRTPAPDGGARFIELCRDFAELEGVDFLQAANALDAEQYPEIFPAAPPKGDLHEAFHHVVRQIQLMENFWVALRLDEPEHRVHPDNRGAMNLFRRWARSEFLRSVYPVVRSIYGQEFQRFCEEQLRLPANGGCLRPGTPVPFTSAAWARCEHIVAHHPILREVVDATPSLEGRACLHTVDVVHRGGVSPVAFAVVTHEERGPEGPARAELFAFMIDNRYFYSGVAECLIRSMRRTHEGTEFVMLPLYRQGRMDQDEWEGRARYFQQLGFVLSTTPEKEPDKGPRDAFVERISKSAPRSGAPEDKQVEYLYLPARAEAAGSNRCPGMPSSATPFSSNQS